MASRYLKGILKGKKPPNKPTSEAILKKRRKLHGDYPTTKSARGILPSEAFLSRRRVLGGAQSALKRETQTKRPRAGYIEGIITGGLGTAAALKYLEKTKKDVKAKKADLKKAVEKHKAADKKRKEAYGKRAPKKDKNYGGR